MTKNKNYIDEVLGEWNDVFMGDVPKMIKNCEVKNKDGSYSCITCGIKRDKIGEWWKQKLKEVEQRKVVEMIEKLYGIGFVDEITKERIKRRLL